MAEAISFFSNTFVTYILIAYIVVLWVALTAWTTMDIFSRTNSWMVRIGSILMVGLGFFFGLVLYLIIRPTTTLEDISARELEERILLSQTHSASCPHCSAIIREDFLFCSNCGFEVKKECPKCQSKLEIGFNQCPYCGISVGIANLPQIKEKPLVNDHKTNFVFGTLSRLFTSPVVAKPTEVKRGRGRPRKEVSEQLIPKRGRGRPRKNVLIQ